MATRNCRFQAWQWRAALASLSLALLASCASTPAPQAGAGEPSAGGQEFRPTSLLLFGDHGYELKYLEAKVLDPPRNLEQAIALERDKWLSDKRPPAEFAPSALVKLESTGGYVPASGMMPVSRAMKAWCASTPCDAALMAGDNVYPNGPTLGADGVADSERFENIFMTPYRDFTELSPGFRIYSALGNHDWRTSREAALGEVRFLEATPPFYMDGLFYSVKPPAGKGEVEIFVLDTEVMLAGTTVYEDEMADDGSELPPTEVEEPEPWTRPANERERNMAAWLEQALRNSTARWKIVMGHHPLWSSAGGKFEQARVMRRLILPTLCRYADMYVAGHEHTLEVHTDSCAQAVPGTQLPPLPQVVSGAAAKQRPLNSWFVAHQERKYPELATQYAKGLVWGYMYLSLEREQAVLQVISTPNDRSGANVVEFRQAFARRSINP